ncbi:hypothetical protein GH714_023938 [Hevea brasiliensis]|uniref:Uncharacterized protein n=1 Tax=Hevea brasiliensis TaxID=3981 RepID=A0A6A6LR04_HEVBR|nr:hypothetical protein GH714_023938 [Hevea brasiliensis]
MAIQGETSNDTSIVIEDLQASLLVTSMKSRLESLAPVSSERCIYRVPKRLRDVNENAYTPRLVSIGPFHHGRAGLGAMEEHKWRHLQNFLRQTKVKLDDLVNFIKEREERARNCYAETIELTSNEFVQIITVDAAFTIDILLGRVFPHLTSAIECVYDRTGLVFDIYRDMLLIENQLPYFILSDVLDFARAEQLLPFKQTQPPKQRRLKFKGAKSLTELHEAGVKFKVASNKHLLDIQFTDGVLEIPYVRVSEMTEAFFRNLIAFEQCHCKISYVSDYIVLMDILINTPHDVELLVKCGIMKNMLANNLEASMLFNNLAKEILFDSNVFYYSLLCEDLNDYCKVRWHKWQATLKHNYFNNPWAVISVIAAVILLLLTFIRLFVL